MLTDVLWGAPGLWCFSKVSPLFTLRTSSYSLQKVETRIKERNLKYGFEANKCISYTHTVSILNWGEHNRGKKPHRRTIRSNTWSIPLYKRSLGDYLREQLCIYNPPMWNHRHSMRSLSQRPTVQLVTTEISLKWSLTGFYRWRAMGWHVAWIGTMSQWYWAINQRWISVDTPKENKNRESWFFLIVWQ